MADIQTIDDLLGALNEYPEYRDPQIAMHVIALDVNQMINSFTAMEQCAPSASNTGYTAYLESCLLHTRNLLEFFIDSPDPGKIIFRDFVLGSRLADLVQALDLNPLRELIDQYFAHMNWMRSTHFSSPVEEIIGSAVIALAEAFNSFIELLSGGLMEREFLENSTQRALKKLEKLEYFRERSSI